MSLNGAAMRSRTTERVTRKQGRRTARTWDHYSRIGRSRGFQPNWRIDKAAYNQTVPFFFMNFPRDWNHEQMWRTFSGFGRVIDIHIPDRIDKYGRQFRGSKKNDARKTISFEANRRADMSYADILRGSKKNGLGIERIPTIQEKFYMEGYFSISLKPMGGKLVLLQCADREELEDLVANVGDWLGQWFDEVRPWSPSMVATERFTWIKCQGVPLHAWGPEFSHDLSMLWGKFISLDDSTSNKKRFDVRRVLISTPYMEMISKKLTVKINGEFYNLQCTEEEHSNNLFTMRSANPSDIGDEEDNVVALWHEWEEEGLKESWVEETLPEKIDSRLKMNQKSNKKVDGGAIGLEANGPEKKSHENSKQTQDSLLTVIDLEGTEEQLNNEERRGCRGIQKEMEGFEVFIVETGLIDLPMIGRRFTWYQPNERTMSHLDRFLINEEWLVTWEGLKQWGLKRSISDHCPMLLKNEVKNWGPKPFCFFDAWLRHPKFKDKVAEAWRTKEIQGSGDFILKEKLKRTKVFLKKWSTEHNSELNKTIEECKEVILQIDVKGGA
ncbi:hypothetical protein SLEP1_g38570 [Rubroshorea leprosula]|nr:hypothetical protein SLEP1_g38570 [Rubroshorea leprosula]